MRVSCFVLGFHLTKELTIVLLIESASRCKKWGPKLYFGGPYIGSGPISSCSSSKAHEGDAAMERLAKPTAIVGLLAPVSPQQKEDVY